MASIFDVFGRLLLDDKQFQADAEKAGDQAGLTVGKRMSMALKSVGAKVIGGALATGFGLAAKGAVELENAVASFQAATGASAQEAQAAGKVINRVAGEERTSLEAVTEAAIRVKRDLGATGDTAALLTKQFVRFARVTRQDAAGAVSAYDDILDSWGLTASDAVGIMDKLLVSQQRFGGEITETQQTLAALAPAMRAANLTIDDGIALLGLFGAKGLDAGQASAAFAKALTKVKSPEELKAAIADISNTQDSFQRAAKAADLFGAKAGAKLANALGGANLDDYAISVADAAGAVDKAADVLDNTFSGRIAKALSVAGAQLREFGAGFGPALTGLAALASLAGTLGGGKLVGGLAKGVTKGGGLLKTKLLQVIMNAIIPAQIAGASVGEAASAGVAEGMSGSKAKRLIGTASDKLGTFAGSALGKALSVAFAAVALVELVKTYSDVTEAIRHQTEELAAKTATFTQEATTDALMQARQGVAEDLARMGHDPIAEALGLSARKSVEDTLGQLDAEIAKRTAATADAAITNMEKMRGGIGDSLAGVRTEASKTATSTGVSLGTIGTAAGALGTAVKNGATKSWTAIVLLRQRLSDEAQAMIDGYYQPLIDHDTLLVQKDEVAAAKRAAAATKAGSAERHQANLTLHNAEAALERTRTALLESGQLSAKEQKTWLSELQKKYKTATGDAKTKIGALIAKIKELQGISGAKVSIAVSANIATAGNKERAAGGPLAAGDVSWVGEGGNYRELFVAPRAGTVIPHRESEALVRSALSSREDMPAGDTNISVMLPVREAPDPFETADELRRLHDFGVLTVASPTRTRK